MNIFSTSLKAPSNKTLFLLTQIHEQTKSQIIPLNLLETLSLIRVEKEK